MSTKSVSAGKNFYLGEEKYRAELLGINDIKNFSR
jgi:hypothetical protein